MRAIGLALFICRRRAASTATEHYRSMSTCSPAGGDACSAGWPAEFKEEAPWVAYLLVSPTRSSFTGVSETAKLPDILKRISTDENCPKMLSILRPFRLAEHRQFETVQDARRAAWRTARASGFRARLRALQSDTDGTHETHDGDRDLDLHAGLDGLTYVEVEVLHPSDEKRRATVRALVDTGSTDCDLQKSVINSLGLPLAGEASFFETAAGKKVSMDAFVARVRYGSTEVDVQVNPADEEIDSEQDDELDRIFGFKSTTDDAILGLDALSKLGLVVDCSNRRLIPADELPAPVLEGMSMPFTRSTHVPLKLSNPKVRKRTVTVKALVDTGSTDVDLGKRYIYRLRLRVDKSEAPAQFETAGGVTIEAPIYRADAVMLGRRASVRVSPSESDDSSSDEEEEEEEVENEVDDNSSGESEDEALLGHDALASLKLLVDCRGRRLLVT